MNDLKNIAIQATLFDLTFGLTHLRIEIAAWAIFPLQMVTTTTNFCLTGAGAVTIKCTSSPLSVHCSGLASSKKNLAVPAQYKCHLSLHWVLAPAGWYQLLATTSHFSPLDRGGQGRAGQRAGGNFQQQVGGSIKDLDHLTGFEEPFVRVTYFKLTHILQPLGQM